MLNNEIQNLEKFTSNSKNIQPRLLSITQFMLYSGMGRNRAVEYARQYGWVVQFGRRVYIDKVKFDEFVEQSPCN